MNDRLLVSLHDFAKHDETLLQYIQALELDIMDGYSWVELGKRLSAKKQFILARQCYDRAIEVKPYLIDAWLNKGNALNYSNQYDEAIKCYDKAIEIDPNNVDALNAKGLALVNMGKFDEAIKCYDKAIEIDPNNADAWFNKGDVLLAHDNYPEATKCLSRAHVLDPNNTSPLEELHEIYSNHTYDFDNARRIADKLLAIQPSSENKVRLAEDLIKMRQYEEGRKVAVQALDETPPTSVKRQSIIRFLILSSYLLKSDLDYLKDRQAYKELLKFLEYYKNQDDDFSIEETQWSFKGLVHMIDTADLNTKAVLYDLISLLRGEKNRARILANMATTIADSNLQIRHWYYENKIILPAICGVVVLVILVWYPQSPLYHTIYHDIAHMPYKYYMPINGIPHDVDIDTINNGIYISGQSAETVLDGNNIYPNPMTMNYYPSKHPWFGGPDRCCPNGSIAVDPITHKVYVADASNNTVSVINTFYGNTRIVTVGKNPHDIAFDNSTHKVYVANTDDGTVSVIDGTTDKVIGSHAVQVGHKPSGIAVDPSKNKVYVANTVDGTVSVIDGTTDKVIHSVKVGYNPSGIDVDPSKNKVYVANYGNNTVSVIDGTTDKVIGLPLNVGFTPLDVAVDPSTHKVYVANADDGTVSVIDGTTDKVIRSISAFNSITHIALDPKNHFAYLTGTNQTKPMPGIMVIDTNWTKGYGDYLPVGRSPTSIAIDPSKNKVYVANTDDGTVSVIDGTTNKTIDTKQVGKSPISIAVDPSTHKVYVANNGDNTVSVINGTTDKVIGLPLNVGKNPLDVAVDPSTHKVYVANNGDNTTSVINGTTDKVTAVKGFKGNLPDAIAVSKNKVYVTNYGGNTTSVINGTTDTYIHSVKVGIGPTSVFVDSATRTVYVTNFGDGTVSVINGTTDQVSNPITVAKRPYRGAVVDPRSHMVLLVNIVDNSISFFTPPPPVVSGQPAPQPNIKVTGFPCVTSYPRGIAVEGDRIYVSNSHSNTLSIISEEILNRTTATPTEAIPTCH